MSTAAPSGDADAELAEARLDGVEGGPQEVGAVDDERVVLDPDRAVGVVEAGQRVVRGLDEPQARGRDPGMVERRLDARFEAPDDRRVGSVRRLAGERGEDQAAALVGIDERVEHRRGQLLREVLAGFGRVERTVDGLGEGRAIHDAPARPGRRVGRGDGRDEGEHEQCREEGSEHRRSLGGPAKRRVGRRPVKSSVRRRAPVREGPGTSSSARGRRTVSRVPVARFGPELPSGGRRVASACCLTDHEFAIRPVRDRKGTSCRFVACQTTRITKRPAPALRPEFVACEATAPRCGLRCLGGFRHDTCRKPLPCVRLMRT